jgi:hypothetical protein
MKERTQFNYAQRWRIEHSSRRQAQKKRKLGILASAFLLFLLAVLLALPWIWQYKLKYDLSKVEKRIEYYHEVEITLQELESLQAEIARMESFLNTAKAKAKNPEAILGQITDLLPAGTEVTSYALGADYFVQINLVLAGPLDVAELWKKFRDSGLFLDFDLNSVSLTDEVKTLSLNLKMKQ